MTQNRHVTKKSTNIKTITHTLTQESYTPPMSIYQPLMCYHILFFNSPLQPGNLWSETMFHDVYNCKDGIFMNRRANSSYFHEARYNENGLSRTDVQQWPQLIQKGNFSKQQSEQNCYRTGPANE